MQPDESAVSTPEPKPADVLRRWSECREGR